MRTNNNIRIALMDAQVSVWELCEKLGISESTYYRLMHTPLDQETTKKWLKAIKEVSQHNG